MDDHRYTLIEHLSELRTRLGRALIAVAIATACTAYFADQIFHFLVTPILWSSDQISEKLGKGLGIRVKYTAVEPDAYRGFGFPGADELGNMFQVYRDFEREVLGARSADVARSLDPALQNFDQWLAANKSKIKLA